MEQAEACGGKSGAQAASGSGLVREAAPAAFVLAPFVASGEASGVVTHPKSIESSEEINGIDVLFYELCEAELGSTPMFITAFFVTERQPKAADVQATLRQLVLRNPRLALVPERSTRWTSQPVLLAKHCLLVRPKHGHLTEQMLPQALSFCNSLKMQADGRIPLWRQYILPLEDGRCGVLTVLHHCYGDGQGGVGAMLSLVSSGERGSKPQTWAPLQKRDVIHRHGALDVLLLIVAVLLASITLSIKGLRILFTWKSAFQGSGSVPSSRKRCQWTKALRLEAVRDAKNILSKRWKHKVTINDIMLGVLSASFADFMRRTKRPQDSIYAGVPFSYARRGPTDARLRNLSIVLPMFMPTKTCEVVQAIADVNSASEALKRDALGEAPLLWFLDAFFLAHVPMVLKMPIVRLLMNRMSVILTNVPGPKEPCAFAEQRIQEFVPFAPSPGAGALGIAMISYGDRYTVGIYTDASQEHPAEEMVARTFEQKFEELAHQLSVPAPFA